MPGVAEDAERTGVVLGKDSLGLGGGGHSRREQIDQRGDVLRRRCARTGQRGIAVIVAGETHAGRDGPGVGMDPCRGNGAWRGRPPIA